RRTALVNGNSYTQRGVKNDAPQPKHCLRAPPRRFITYFRRLTTAFLLSFLAQTKLEFSLQSAYTFLFTSSLPGAPMNRRSFLKPANAAGLALALPAAAFGAEEKHS